MRVFVAVLLVLLTFSATFALADSAPEDRTAKQPPRISEDPIFVSGSFMTAEFLHDATPALRRFYIAGVVDGMGLGVALGAPQERIEALSKWRERISMEQLAAIVVRYLGQHPEEWHYPAHVAIVNAITNLGKQYGFFR